MIEKLIMLNKAIKTVENSLKEEEKDLKVLLCKQFEKYENSIPEYPRMDFTMPSPSDTLIFTYLLNCLSVEGYRTILDSFCSSTRQKISEVHIPYVALETIESLQTWFDEQIARAKEMQENYGNDLKEKRKLQYEELKKEFEEHD